MAIESNSRIRNDDDVDTRLKRNKRRSYFAIALAVIAVILAIVLRSCAALNEAPGAGSTCQITVGPSGAAGIQGLSAYDLWLKVGNKGTQQDFLDSLVGKQGKDGFIGSNGVTGATGPAGATGAKGTAGESAYQIWLDNGHTGTTQDFLNAMVGSAGVAGVNGLSAYNLWLKLGHVGSESDFLASLVGPAGPIGATGAPGICTTGAAGLPGASGSSGLSAYEVWLANGHTGGTQTEFLNSLIGPSGSPGPVGPQGIQGTAGPQGAPGTSGISSIYRGSFLSLVNQSVSAVNTRTAMFFEQTDISNGVTITNGGGTSCALTPSTCTNITFANAGVYNLQFSAQIYNGTGGGSGNIIKIWLGQNQTDVPWSATNISANSNNPYRVAAWNFFVTVNAGDTAQIYWATDTTSISLVTSVANTTGPTAGQYPAIPSLIMTVNQVG